MAIGHPDAVVLFGLEKRLVLGAADGPPVVTACALSRVSGSERPERERERANAPGRRQVTSVLGSVLGGIRVGEKKERKDSASLPRRASTDGSTCVTSPL
jgi:hypothetical protein